MDDALRVQASAPARPAPSFRPACTGMLQRYGDGTCGCGFEETHEEDLLQRSPSEASAGPALAPPIVRDVLASPGRPLEPATRASMERSLGHDFGSVRIHTSARAAESARAVHARAYTVGSDVVFADGRYAPGTSDGRRLLAHELAHVVQQSGALASRRSIVVQTESDPAEREAEQVLRSTTTAEPSSQLTRSSVRSVQRQYMPHGEPNPMDDPRVHPSGAPGAATCGRPAHCPPAFCQPYSSASFATHMRTKMLPGLMLGIAVAVDSRVVSLWHDHLLGGTTLQDLTSTFGGDFAKSRSTKKATDFLLGALRTSLTTSPPTFPPMSSHVTFPLESRVGPEIAELDDPTGPNQMNFSIPRDVAGNLAGGIGKNQRACKSGARPSPFDDERLAKGSVTVVRDPRGDIFVYPIINYTVKDTIDLCPGDCGTKAEQVATVPISQFEATGISGDVPFTVEFTNAPPFFTIPASSPPSP
jgi:Domain of unknown function (DUF4157)